MHTTPPTPGAPPLPPPPPPPSPSPADRLVRRPDDGRIAGVAAGVAHHLGIETWIVRLAIVMLTVTTGYGIPAYIAAWVLMPVADGDEGPVRHVRPARDGRSIAIAIGVIVVLLALIDRVELFSPPVLLATALIGLGVMLFTDAGPMARRAVYGQAVRDRAPAVAPPPGPHTTAPPSPGPGPWSAYEPYAGAWRDPVASSSAAAGAGDGVVSARRRRSLLGPLAMAAWATAMGAIILLDRLGVIVLSPVIVLSTSLAIIGAALVVGTLVGRARWLIPVGIVVSALLVGVVSLEVDVPLRGPVGEVVTTPASPAAVPDAYEMLLGSQTIDLTGIDLTALEGDPLPVTVRHSVGEVIILVPESADVTVSGTIRAGEGVLFDREVSGTAVSLAAVHEAAGVDADQIELDIEVLLGEVVVRTVP